MNKLQITNLFNIDLAQYNNYSVPQIRESNFQKAFYILPKDKRIAVNNFYIFCAYLDDIVDNDANRNIAEARMVHWKQAIKQMAQDNVSNDLLPLWQVFDKYNISYDLIFQLIDGIERDLHQNRYNTFEDMLSYCHGVASIVGLICVKIFVDENVAQYDAQNQLQAYAINLGYALQITNIMRDIGEDYNRNYVYIPQEFLMQFNYSEDDIKNRIYNQNFFNLMEHLYQKAEKYYSLANKYYDSNSDLQAAQCMRFIYYKLLQKIRNSQYTIYEKKIKISTFEKLWIVAKSINH